MRSFIKHAILATHHLFFIKTQNGKLIVATLLLLFALQVESFAQTPYGGKARSIPGKIEAEDFDLGGEGVGYHDRQAKNPGGGYRLDEGPGIKGMTVPAGKPAWYKSNDGSPTIGWFFVGEWLKYTVDVKAGVYDINLRIATPMNKKAFNIYLDDKLIAYIDVPNTGEYDKWVTVHFRGAKIKKDGSAVLKIQAGGMDLDECDVNWIEFLPVNTRYIDFL